MSKRIASFPERRPYLWLFLIAILASIIRAIYVAAASAAMYDVVFVPHPSFLKIGAVAFIETFIAITLGLMLAAILTTSIETLARRSP